MRLIVITNGVLQSNGYILMSDEKNKDGLYEVSIIDCGSSPQQFISTIEHANAYLNHIILTHKHHDHIDAATVISKHFSAPIYIHEEDNVIDGAISLKGSEFLYVGDSPMEIIQTKGHTKGSICIKLPKERWIFTGDTLFDIDLGYTHFEGGSSLDMAETVINILSNFDNDYFIYPGHSVGATMKYIKENNKEYMEILGKNIKMVALDLDQTTLSDSEHISDENVEAINALVDKGIYPVISTGRTFSSLPKSLDRLKGLEYIITSNGAKIFKINDLSNANVEIIFSKCLEETAVMKIIDILKDNEIECEAFIDGQAYISQKDYDDIENGKYPNRCAEYVLKTRKPVENIFELMKENASNIENLSLNYNSIQKQELARYLLSDIDGIELTQSFKLNNEVGPIGISKQSALAFLIDMLGLDKSMLMAMGDSFNDMKMIKYAKIGVAMENAEQDLKQVSDFVTKAHDENGVAYALKAYGIVK